MTIASYSELGPMEVGANGVYNWSSLLNHCFHASFYPQQDWNGKIKCSDDTPLVQTNLFRFEDLHAYNAFINQMKRDTIFNSVYFQCSITILLAPILLRVIFETESSLARTQMCFVSSLFFGTVLVTGMTAFINWDCLKFDGDKCFPQDMDFVLNWMMYTPFIAVMDAVVNFDNITFATHHAAVWLAMTAIILDSDLSTLRWYQWKAFFLASPYFPFVLFQFYTIINVKTKHSRAKSTLDAFTVDTSTSVFEWGCVLVVLYSLVGDTTCTIMLIIKKSELLDEQNDATTLIIMNVLAWVAMSLSKVAYITYVLITRLCPVNDIKKFTIRGTMLNVIGDQSKSPMTSEKFWKSTFRLKPPNLNFSDSEETTVSFNEKSSGRSISPRQVTFRKTPQEICPEFAGTSI